METFQRAILRLLLVHIVLLLLPIAIVGLFIAVAVEFAAARRTAATVGFPKRRILGLPRRLKRLMRRVAVSLRFQPVSSPRKAAV
jgi:hypothetical protein